jgi:hypothetical protein
MSAKALGVSGIVAFAALAATPARAQIAAGVDGGGFTDRRELIVPVPAGSVEVLRIDNPMGRVEIRGGGRADSIHVVAEKHASTLEALGRLRVHFAAFQSGEVQLDTRVELEGRERSVPLGGSGIDLVIEVPAEVAVEAKTFGGDVTASGLRAGARLETTGGRIGVSDVRGGVVTRQLRGGQTVAGVEGDVDLDGVEGDMDLRRLGGGRVDARLVDGSIHADDLRSSWVRLTTTTGEIVLLGPIRAGAHYELRSYAGDVRVLAVGAPAPFELRARTATAVDSSFPLRATHRQGEWFHATFAGPGTGPAAGPGRAAEPAARMALLDVSAVLGQVVLKLGPPAEPRETLH